MSRFSAASSSDAPKRPMIAFACSVFVAPEGNHEARASDLLPLFWRSIDCVPRLSSSKTIETSAFDSRTSFSVEALFLPTRGTQPRTAIWIASMT